MKHIAFALILMLCGLLLLAGEAVAEDVKETAQTAIAKNFDFEDCPAVTEATKMLDGSIDALCTNGETFRIGTIGSLPNMAMRCSAAASIGVTGCSHWGVNPAKVREFKEEHEMFKRCRANSASCTRQEIEKVNEMLRDIGMEPIPVSEPQPTPVREPQPTPVREPRTQHDAGAIDMCPPPHRMTRDGCQ